MRPRHGLFQSPGFRARGGHGACCGSGARVAAAGLARDVVADVGGDFGRGLAVEEALSLAAVSFVVLLDERGAELVGEVGEVLFAERRGLGRKRGLQCHFNLGVER